MVTIRLFAQAKETAGQPTLTVDANTIDQALAAATTEFGDSFTAVLETSNIWLNGSPVDGEPELKDSDELAILPPVSGG